MTNVYLKMYRATIRATQETIPGVLIKMMESKLAAGSPGDAGLD